MLDPGLAEWIDDQLAGGEPPKWVAMQASAAVRHIAAMARSGELPAGEASLVPAVAAGVVS